MFGDSFGLAGEVGVVVLGGLPGDLFRPISIVGGASLPLAGASRRVKVAEQNKALPMDRIHFTYNHFHNALDFSTGDYSGTPAGRVFPVDRYTLAAEKTFLDGLTSVEVRMPFAGTADFETADFGVSGGEIGNLAVLLKLLLLRTDRTSAVIGLTVDVPTGSDVTGHAVGFEYVVRNEAVHLGPYAGFLWEPNERLFYQGFLQIDVPANSNTVNADAPALASPLSGRLHEQTVMYLDLGTGCWLHRNPHAHLLTGLAALVEIHYATTLSDSDSLLLVEDPTILAFGNSANRVDEVNLTVGLHAELRSNTILRVGGVFPLTDRHNRSFDSELQVQVERRF
jgi:hypothetical protein